MKKKEKILLIGLISLWTSYICSFAIICLIHQGFDLRYLISVETLGIMALFLLIGLLLGLWYYDKHYWVYNGKNVMKGRKGDLDLEANLEHARFQSDDEIEKNYKTYSFSELKDVDITGTPIIAKDTKGGLKVTFAKPSHSLVIGTTGSGKTTTFVSPMIQILSETKTKPSLFISDPKGELLKDHRLALEEKGYEVKVIDLRNPYNSVRWNPMERPYLLYQKALHLENQLIADEERGCYIFEGTDYYSKEEVEGAIQVLKQQLLDEVYEDLNDITLAICPVNNKNEPMWESGAKNLALAIALAMLEDSSNPELGLTKEKFNFYSLMKVATSTDDDCKELINYFKGRSPLSRAVSLSKQVMDSSDKTRGSYLSSLFDKLSIFSDMSLCALTSENEIEFSSMGERPIALFLQIPDEKETRHTLASLLVLQAYKELVRKANSNPDLTLKKPVYFILDEFGNLPKINKLEQMITVGRSRNIWMNLIVQSYSQLSKVYDEKSADIIKSNCNIQVFIGTTDLKTIEDFSKRCGNYSIVQRSVGYSSSKANDISSNQAVKERPLIYPSELQTLNKPGDIGHAIVTIFGYMPIRSMFTPCFECKEYKMTRTDESLSKGRYFDSRKAFYDLRIRNQAIESKAKKSEVSSRKEATKNKMILNQILNLSTSAVTDVLDREKVDDLGHYIRAYRFNDALGMLNIALIYAKENGNVEKEGEIKDAIRRIEDFAKVETKTPIRR